MNWAKKTVNQYLNIIEKIDALSNRINDPMLIDLQKQLAQMEKKYLIAKKAMEINENISLLEEFLNIEETEDRDLANEELINAKNQLIELEKEFFYKEPQKSRIILEIRPGVGGKEACLFVDLLSTMYQEYCIANKWSWEVLSLEHNTIGGIESIVIGIEGLGVFENMEHESGIHRIQRVPVTESCGRIHTSTASVAILFEPDEVDVKIDEQYLKIEAFRAGGAGGQHVNKTESAIRLTYSHPDMEKIIVSIQDEKSQHKNKSKAMKILRAKILQSFKEKTHNEQAIKRKIQVGNADRSDKIRTYNFPQNRVTDHRAGVGVHAIQKNELLLPKDLQIIIDNLKKLNNDVAN